MKLALFDKGGGDFYDSAEAAAGELFEEHSFKVFDPPANLDVESLRSFTHIICHLNGTRAAPSWLSLLSGDIARVRAIIRVSSVAGSSGMSDSFKKPYRVRANGTWIFHLIEPSGSLDTKRWKQILSAFKDWNPTDDTISTQLAEIFDPMPEVPLALRLLCEAYAIPKDASGSRNFQPKESGTKAISVHCPDPATWFDLLGATPPKSDIDEAAITAFGRLMGDAGDAAMDLARAIVQPGSDIGGPAGRFVEKVSEITAVQAGGAQ